MVEAAGISVTPPGTAMAALSVTEVAPAEAAAVTKDDVWISCPLEATYATLVPIGIAAGKPEPVRVMVVVDDEPGADTLKAVSSTTPTQRSGRIVPTGVAVGASTAFAELPVFTLPVLLIMLRFVPTIARAPEAITVVAEQTTALNTVSGSSATTAAASPASVDAGQYCEKRFCFVTGSVYEQPRKTPVTWFTPVPVATVARVAKPRDNTT